MAWGNQYLKVMFGGIDITDRVLSAPISPIMKPDWGQIPDLPNLTMEVRNDTHFFSGFDSGSPIYNVQLSTIIVTVERGFLPRYEGTVKSIDIDIKGKKATIVVENSLQRMINKNSKAYFDNLTAPELMIKLFILHQINYDIASFSKAIDILNDIPVNCNLNPSALDWIGNLADLLQLLSNAGMGRLYTNYNGTIGFETWIKNYSPPIALTLTDDDLMEWPTVDNVVRDRVGGYSIEYLFGTIQNKVPQIDNRTNIQSMDFGVNSAVGLVDAGGATYIGEKLIEISTFDYYQFCLFINHQKLFAIQMDSGIRLTSQKLGIDRTFVVEGMDWSDPKYAKLYVRYYVSY